MASTGELTGMLPGFEFLQGLFKTAGAGLPAAGQWVAPTLDPAELDKRIQDLKTVQFWLEQNARVLAATIQALEVQRMTLSTLHNLNLPLSELTEALKIKLPPTPPAAPAPPPAPTALFHPIFGTLRQAAEPPAEPPAAPPVAAPAAAAAPPAADPAKPAVDPMQWWGALTQQFTELAAKAVKDGSEALAHTAPLPGAAPADASKATGRAAAAPPRAAASGARAGTPRSGAKTTTKPATKSAAKPASKTRRPG